MCRSCCGSTAKASWACACDTCSRTRAPSQGVSWCGTYQVCCAGPCFEYALCAQARPHLHLAQLLSGAQACMGRCAGVYYGTMLHRLDAFVLKWLPNAIKEPLKKTVSSVVSVGNKGLQATAGRVTNTLVGRCILSIKACCRDYCTLCHTSLIGREIISFLSCMGNAMTCEGLVCCQCMGQILQCSLPLESGE